ncbi:MAG: hypothetical protein OEO19_14750 [Gammaproteobacteria bacterium]|nr:hypothetical protein [Gammaproteobacteria bacterium]MDH3447994.1 hypothetical protein [Gammaproteobacteria bacterium]
MQFSEQQVHEFEQSGYLFFPKAFNAGETRMLNQATIGVYQQQREEVRQWHQDYGTWAHDDTLAALVA